MRSRVFLIFAFAILANCTGQPQSDDDWSTYESSLDSGKELIVFTVMDSDPKDFGTGRIDGEAEPSVPDIEPGISFRQMDAAPGAFFEPFRQCGEKKALYEDFNHGFSISVPVGVNSPERKSLMTDLEFVDCVKKRVSFSFTVGTGRFPNLDYIAFESLHAQKN